MPSVRQPYNSIVRISPYSQRLLQYGIQDSKVYLSKATNSLLTAWTYGNGDGFLDTTSSTVPVKYDGRDSCIMDGLETSWELEGNTLKVTIEPGTAIVDSTLLIFPEPTNLDLDLTPYGSETQCGPVIVSINFQWIDSTSEQPPKLKISYVDPNDSHVVEPNGWWLSQDKLIITAFSFEKGSSGAVTSSSILNYNPKPMQNINHYQLLVKGYPFEIGPLPKLWYHILNMVTEGFARKLVHYIPGCVDASTLPENEVRVPIQLQNVENTLIRDLHFTFAFDNTKLTNPRIETGPVSTNAGKSAQFSLNQSGDNGIVDIAGITNDAILDGVVCTLVFDLLTTIAPGVELNFYINAVTAYDPLGQAILMQGLEQPELFMDPAPPFIVTRPGGGPYDYSLCWKLGTAPYRSTSERDYYADVNISKLSRKDVMVQCFIDDLAFNPAAIQHINESMLRIWMPQILIDKSPIPSVKVVIIG